MIKEAFDWLKTNVHAPQWVKHLENSSSVVMVNNVSGEVKVVDKPVPLWSASAADIDSFCAAVKKYFDPECSVGIWIARDRVYGVALDAIGEFSIGSLMLRLDVSTAFGELVSLENLSPLDLSDRLRFNLAGTTQTPVSFAELVSVIKFESGANAEFSVQGNDKSIRKSVLEKVSGSDKLPESVVFSFLPYPDLAEQLGRQNVDVRCIVRTNVREQTVSLIPYPEQIGEAYRRASVMVRDAILTRLPELSGSVFFGSPNQIVGVR